jgi:hypothetical protein
LELEASQTERVLAGCHELRPVAMKLGRGGSELALIDALEALARLKNGDETATAAVDAAAEEIERVDSRYHLAFVLDAAAEIDVEAGRLERALRRADSARRSAAVVDRIVEVQRARLVAAAIAVREQRCDEGRQIVREIENANPERLPARLSARVQQIRQLLMTR